MLVSSGFGPGVIINTEAKRATWIGTGSYIYLDGVRNSKGVQITRARGTSSAVEKITKVQRIGQTLDLQMQDSLGGTGLLRITLSKDGQSGKASWQHATDVFSGEQLEFCTKNVLN